MATPASSTYLVEDAFNIFGAFSMLDPDIIAAFSLFLRTVRISFDS
jgi:hypothetical protein